MPLYNLMREYEERRQALIDQLKNNPNMDPAVQHQIYGAIKEIENFLKAIEFQIASTQEQHLSIDLARDRPRPLVEKTKKVVGRIKKGTTKVVKENIPRVTKKMADVPKRYFAKRRERRKLKKEIERELLSRLQKNAAETGALPSEVHTDLHEHEPLPVVGDDLEPEKSSTGEDVTLDDVVVKKIAKKKTKKKKARRKKRRR